MIYIGQASHSGPKEERCVGNDVHTINVTLIPRTAYRLKIITYTVARLNNEYKDRELLNDEQHTINSTNLYFELIFSTKDLPSKNLKIN